MALLCLMFLQCISYTFILQIVELKLSQVYDTWSKIKCTCTYLVKKEAHKQCCNNYNHANISTIRIIEHIMCVEK